jgi:hypothetical protein
MKKTTDQINNIIDIMTDEIDKLTNKVMNLELEIQKSTLIALNNDEIIKTILEQFKTKLLWLILVIK